MSISTMIMDDPVPDHGPPEHRVHRLDARALEVADDWGLDARAHRFVGHLDQSQLSVAGHRPITAHLGVPLPDGRGGRGPHPRVQLDLEARVGRDVVRPAGEEVVHADDQLEHAEHGLASTHPDTWLLL